MSLSRTSEEPRGGRLPFLRWGRREGGIEAAVRRVIEPRLAHPERGRDWRRWVGTLLLLRPLGRVSDGNVVQMLPDGDDVFEAIWAAIEGARERVLVNTYLLDPDPVGLRTLEALTEAARRGCKVYLLYDSFGSSALRERHVRGLVEAGGRVQAFNPVLTLRSPFSRLVRNHRKILVVDDGPAFCGGMNISCDYAGERHGTNRFRDTHLRLLGPCVEDLASLVLAAFGEGESDDSQASPEGYAASLREENGSLVQVLESNVRREKRAIQKALRYTIVRCERTCFLTSPYFVPPKRLVRDLQRAAKRGVDVRVLTAGLSDVPAVRLASRHLYGRLLKAGVRIFEMRERTLHAKTATVDGVYGSVGSFNLDYWSYRRNLEVTVSTLDRYVAEQLEKRFLADLALSHEVRLEDWSRRGPWERVVQWLAYNLLRL